MHIWSPNQIAYYIITEKIAVNNAVAVAYQTPSVLFLLRSCLMFGMTKCRQKNVVILFVDSKSIVYSIRRISVLHGLIDHCFVLLLDMTLDILF